MFTTIDVLIRPERRRRVKRTGEDALAIPAPSARKASRAVLPRMAIESVKTSAADLRDKKTVAAGPDGWCSFLGLLPLLVLPSPGRSFPRL